MRTPAVVEVAGGSEAGEPHQETAVPGPPIPLAEQLARYCHQSRNILHNLKMCLYLARRSGESPCSHLWESLEARYAEVERCLDRVHLNCRAISLTLVRLPLDLLFHQHKARWAASLAENGRRLILSRPAEPVAGEFDPSRLQLAFDDLVTWRCRAGSPRTDLRVAWHVRDGAFHVVWDEPAHRRKLSHADAETRHDSDIAGLVLPLLKRIAEAHCGAIKPADGPDFRLSMTWPVDVRPQARESPPCC